MRNYFNYFTEIEEFFVRKRGKNLLISPLDWCLVELWRDGGIPLHIVLRGIERSFESSSKRQKSVPRTIFYCHQAVLEAHEEYQKAMVGSSESKETESFSSSIPEEKAHREAVQSHIENLEKQLQKGESQAFERAGQRIAALREEVLFSQTVSYPEIDQNLVEIGSMLASDLKADLGREKAREIGSEVKKELKMYRKRLSKEMYQRLESNCLERRILALHNLFEFNLMGVLE
ncbi:MAG: hypothetical protein VYA53_07310 [Acidobacteriota bacterium]|nr:hypothetical protein [Acidobacteriota bacterium]